MKSIELPDAPLSVLTGEYDGTDAEIASYVTHRPLSLPPQTHYSISASLLEGSCSGNHLQPLHSSPRSVSPILTNDWDAIFDEDNCRDRVEMPGLGIGQEPPGASGPLGSTLANALAHGQSHECSYIACLSFGSIKDWPAHGMACRFPVCGYFTQDHSDHILHERDHSQKAGNETFCCVEHLCPFTSKR